jgi:hypothetical protein
VQCKQRRGATYERCSCSVLRFNVPSLRTIVLAQLSTCDRIFLIMTGYQKRRQLLELAILWPVTGHFNIRYILKNVLYSKIYYSIYFALFSWLGNLWSNSSLDWYIKVEKILKGRLDSIPSPSPSVKIQIMGGKVCLRCKGKTMLGVVNKILKTKSLLTSSSNVLPY